MTFKKDGSDGEYNPGPFIGLQFLGAMFAMLGIGVPQAYPEDLPRWPRGKRPQQKRRKHPNRLTISKRVRRKHRRQAA